MNTVFNDAERGTLSAWSWPSRQMAFLKGQMYADSCSSDVNIQHTVFKPKSSDFLYLNPPSHAELLDCIVEADIENVRKALKKRTSYITEKRW